MRKLLLGAVILSLQWTGAAVYGTDYTVVASAGTLEADGSSLTFADAQASAVLTVSIVDDQFVEGAESVALTLLAAAGYALSSPTSAAATIADNDAPSVSVTPASSDLSGSETGSNTITFVLTRSATVGALTVNIGWIERAVGRSRRGVP